MPEINASSIEDIRLGTHMVGALMYGNRELFVRQSVYTYYTPGDFSLTLPDWVSAYGVVMSGAGGGGVAGNGGNGGQGYGGRGGHVHGFWSWVSPTHRRVIDMTIGSGGAGGRGASGDARYGEDGGDTTVTSTASIKYTAAGGTGKPTSGMAAGGVTEVTYSEPLSNYVNLVPGTTYANGPGGTATPAGDGSQGGGGAGGKGGLFGNYNHGRKGGDGFVVIRVWGLHRHQGGVERITLGSDLEARDQFRTALSDRGVDYQTVEYLPFDIDLIGAGSAMELFRGCASLKSVPNMDTSGVTNMQSMFYGCSALTSVPDMVTSSVTIMTGMFAGCSSLTDGNVRLIGRNSKVNTTSMIYNSGLTRLPFYDTDGNPI